MPRPTRMHTTSRRPAGLRGLLIVTPLVLAGLLAGCGSGSGGASAGGVQDQAPQADAGAGARSPQDSALGDTGSAAGTAPASDHVVAGRDVISTGSIDLTSSDVASARARVDVVLTRLGGRVSDENTLTDDHGAVTSSRLVVRVPSARFDDAMHDLAGVAQLRSSSRKGEDVTTQVIDVRSRIAAQRAGVRRLRQLVAQTGDLRALLAVERALTERQGQLRSLRQQRAYLADQTSEATISVSIVRRVAPPSPPAKAAGGFVGGLRHGWHALVTTGTGFLLGLGAVIPFALLGALVGVPAWLVVRRSRRTRAAPPPVES
ncbi:MAG TPA: DUF4349 domain-containing protein [Nocardioides sp.]|nr:DUF4349 domain-containing protein [Nocardioides sp.]